MCLLEKDGRIPMDLVFLSQSTPTAVLEVPNNSVSECKAIVQDGTIYIHTKKPMYDAEDRCQTTVRRM